MTDRPAASVEHLPHYGEHFPFIPWSLTSKLRVSVGVRAASCRRVLGWPRFVGSGSRCRSGCRAHCAATPQASARCAAGSA